MPDLPLTSYVLAGGQEDKPALIDGVSGRTLTYAELGGAVRSLAGGLVAGGFGKGDVLALMAPNAPEYAVVFHGAAMAGGVVTTINPTYTDTELSTQLRDSGARILVTTPPLAPLAARGCTGTKVAELYTLGEPPGARPIEGLSGPPLAEHVPVGPDDVVAMPYSSGTTGLCKGVMLTQRNMVANIAQMLAALQIRSDECLVAVLPFFHVYGMQVLMNCSLRAGATVVTLPRFDLEQFLGVHQDYRSTRSFVAPPIVLALAKHPMVDEFDLGAASHITPPGWFRPGSVGVTVPNTQTRIVDPVTRADVGIGEEGEIWVSGPQVMKGIPGSPGRAGGRPAPPSGRHRRRGGRPARRGGRRDSGRLRRAASRRFFQPGGDQAVRGRPGGKLQAAPAAGSDRRDPEVGLRQDSAPGAPRRRDRPWGPLSGRRQSGWARSRSPANSRGARIRQASVTSSVSRSTFTSTSRSITSGQPS
jgi:AMP-binding enzyme